MKCKWKESCGYDICMDECCPEFEGVPMTNADRIRAMSDEELAKFLDDCNSHGCVCPARDCRATCHECIVDWLKQPAEVDNE